MGEGEGEDIASDGDSDSFFARNSEEVTRPRVVMPNATADGIFHGDRSCADDDDDDGWEYGGRAPHGAGAHRGKDVYGEDEGEDEDDDDDGGSGGRPIEVRRRQLSWAVHDDDDDKYDDEDEDDDEPAPLSENDDPGGGGGGGSGGDG